MCSQRTGCIEVEAYWYSATDVSLAADASCIILVVGTLTPRPARVVLKEFKPFKRLPPELRLKICKSVLPLALCSFPSDRC